MHALPSFGSVDEEVRFLRGLVAVQRMADEVLEDCLERRLGLAAAADAYLTQCARMIHARAAFVQVLGSDGPVLTRVWGTDLYDIAPWVEARGAVAMHGDRTVFVTELNLGRTPLGSMGFVLPGTFSDGGAQVMALVESVAEMFDSAVLSFLALADGASPLEKLDEVQAEGNLRPRARLGKYELLYPLGSGGMAQVMVARTVNPGGVSRLVALKRILPRLVDDEVVVSQFLDEARLGMKLSHSNLVTVFDFGQVAGTYFIAMELIKGVDFDQLVYLPNHGMTPNFIAGVMCQALEGLQAAHELKADDGHSLGLVHRDLSPHNLMVGFDGHVKVLDFGVAKMREQRTVTLAGIVKGKPLYMSPEQACAEPIDKRSDIFSMGLILYEALMGERAFDRKDDTKTMQAIVNDVLPRPKGMSTEWWRVVSTALAKQPESRFQNAMEMASAIREVVEPMPKAHLGTYVSGKFPRQLKDVETWEQTRNQLARASVEI